ncbi:hypothetical protein BC567DRAFT_64495 [Phyllosticta citribraziliensis]
MRFAPCSKERVDCLFNEARVPKSDFRPLCFLRLISPLSSRPSGLVNVLHRRCLPANNSSGAESQSKSANPVNEKCRSEPPPQSIGIALSHDSAPVSSNERVSKHAMPQTAVCVRRLAVRQSGKAIIDRRPLRICTVPRSKFGQGASKHPLLCPSSRLVAVLARLPLPEPGGPRGPSDGSSDRRLCVGRGRELRW